MSVYTNAPQNSLFDASAANSRQSMHFSLSVNFLLSEFWSTFTSSSFKRSPDLYLYLQYMNKPQEHVCKIPVLQKVNFSPFYQFVLCNGQRRRPLYIRCPLLSDKRQLHTDSHCIPSRVPFQQETPVRNTHASTVNEFLFGLISPTSEGITFSTT